MPINAQELGRRLRAAREACRMTQDEVAKYLGTSRSTVAQMELGNRTVSSLELDRLAYLFGRDIREFLAHSFSEDDTLAALFRAEPTVADNPEVIEKIRECIAIGRELTNLEELLEIRREQAALATYPQVVPKAKSEAVHQGKRVAEQERRRLGLGLSPVPEMVELIERQGVRTGLVDLPDDVSGFSISDAKLGFFVVANSLHNVWRRRFSFAHEYAHLLMDRDRLGTVSRASANDDLIEVRANSFAACFLMPADAVAHFIARLGKGKPSRTLVQVYDENNAVTVEGRFAPNSQDLQIYDVVQMASLFGVSVPAALYRLRNLRLITNAELLRLKEEDQRGRSRTAARLLGLAEPDRFNESNDFRHRFLGLGLDAYRRDLISTGKLRELARLVNAPLEDLEALISDGDWADA
ncbi:MAG TPA: ImmA/IrrE family metallo-endopeptidase [Oligoflexales bacterium]|nr:ImmA/IrrE family metallo-endopeptidase [Oligoflexales bacterium]